MPPRGNLTEQMGAFVRNFIAVNEQERILNLLSLPYIRSHLTKKNSSYGLTCHLEKAQYGVWWRITVIYVDDDEEGNLSHFLILFDEITGEKELEYEGDLVLSEAAAILRSHFRKGDVVARFGGDEFFVFFRGVKSVQMVKRKAESIISDVTSHFHARYDQLNITVSIGIAMTDEELSSAELFHLADEALYQAKRSGKNQYVVRD